MMFGRWLWYISMYYYDYNHFGDNTEDDYDILWWTNHLRWWWKMMIDDVWHICNPDLWPTGLKRFFNVGVTIHQNPFPVGSPWTRYAWYHELFRVMFWFKLVASNTMSFVGNAHSWLVKSPFMKPENHFSWAFHWSSTPNSTGQGAWCWALRGWGYQGRSVARREGPRNGHLKTRTPGPTKKGSREDDFSRWTTGEWTMNRWVFGCPRVGPYRFTGMEWFHRWCTNIGVGRMKHQSTAVAVPRRKKPGADITRELNTLRKQTKKERGLSDHRCVVQQCGNPEPRPQWFNMTEPITNDIERWRTDANGRFCKQYSALFFFQHTKPINQSKNLQIKITRPINQVSLGPTKGAMTGVRDHHTTVGGWVFWLVRGPNSGASLQRTPTGTGLSSENSTGKAMGFWSFWSLSTCFKFLCGISMKFVLNHCGAIASRVMALPRQTGRLYDWFSEYRLRAAGREDILEKVGRLGGKDEWLEKTPVGWRLVRHFIGFFWLINKWIQVTSDHWILIHYHIGLYYPKHKWW